MIGNDIIDLNFAKKNSRWKEQRFLDKLFTSSEQDFILSDENRFQNIWRLWSMKESAYKISFRDDGIVRFNPKDFECSIINATQGKVYSKNLVLRTSTEVTSKFIQTTAFLKHNWLSKVFSLSHSDSEFQHLETYQYAIKTYNTLKSYTRGLVEIKKNANGVPEFYRDGVLQEEHLSITHHGHFAACAITVV